LAKTTGASRCMIAVGRVEAEGEGADGGVGPVAATHTGGSEGAVDAATTRSDEDVLTVTVAGRGRDGVIGLGGTVDGRTGRDGMTGTSPRMAVVGTAGADDGAGSFAAAATRIGGSGGAVDATMAGSDEEVLTVTVAGRGRDGGIGWGGMIDGRTGRDGMTGTDTA
jgi:hypothetical protein